MSFDLFNTDAEIRAGFKKIQSESESESDPNNLDPHAPGAKLDDGKLMAGLLEDFSLALMEIAKVCTHGAKKYSAGGWQYVPDGINRYTHAAWRHRLQKRYEIIDPASGLNHEAQEVWNMLAALELKLRKQMEEGVRLEKYSLT